MKTVNDTSSDTVSQVCTATSTPTTRNRLAALRKAVSAFLAALAAAAAALLLPGCSQPAKSVGNADIAGTYALVSVDGKEVPAPVSHDGTPIQVRSGHFNLGPDGTCGTHMVFVPPKGGEVARDAEATYTREGAELTMRWKGAGLTRGSVENGTFRMTNEGMIFVYRK